MLYYPMSSGNYIAFIKLYNNIMYNQWRKKWQCCDIEKAATFKWISGIGIFLPANSFLVS
jgi:hypothetical protein